MDVKFSYVRWVSAVVVGVTLAACGGGGGGGSEGGVESVVITGTVSGAGSSSVAETALASPVAVVGVNERGVEVDAVVTQSTFTLQLLTGHDYCLSFRDTTAAGATRGVLVIRAAGAASAGCGVFSLTPDSLTVIDLGVITLGASGLAVSALDLADLLPPGTGSYADTDGDSIPDPMDRDDDGDEVRDGDDCGPLDAASSLALTSGGCVANDADDDNDGVADAADGYPLDPLEQVDSNGDGIGDARDADDDGDGIPDARDLDPPAEVVRLMALLGEWEFTYRIISTWSDTYDLTLVEDHGNGLFVSGVDSNGNTATAGVVTDPPVGYDYLLYSGGLILGEAYFFNIAGDTAVGEYWQTDPVTHEIISWPYALTGIRVAPGAAVVAHALGDPAATQAAQILRVAEAAVAEGGAAAGAHDRGRATEAIRSLVRDEPALATEKPR